MIVKSEFYLYIYRFFKPLQDLINVPFMIGGGAVSDLIAFGFIQKDYDIFFRSFEDLMAFEVRIKELGFKLVSETNFGRQYSFLNLNLDLITWHVKTPEQFISLFDFTVNSIMLDGNDLYHAETLIEDCLYKRLIPVRNLNDQYVYRIKRYKEKGYNINIHPALNEISFKNITDMPISPVSFVKVDLSYYSYY
jgi:hypothetical protein